MMSMFWRIAIPFYLSTQAVRGYSPPSARITSRPRYHITALRSSAAAEIDRDVLPSPMYNDDTTIEKDRTVDSVFSSAAQWHQNRRRQMLKKYGAQITPLERDSSSHALALSLLFISNASLFALSLLSGKLHPFQVALLAIFPGSMFSLWTLQILHDLLHGSLLNKRQQKFFGMQRKDL